MSGQSVGDRINAARHSIIGSQLGKTVCKATTQEVMGPKKKHLDALLQYTNEPNVSIPDLADYLIERTSNSSWVVVFKGLVTIHHLMCYGNERFSQYLASRNANFNLENFLDKSGVQGYDMSTFIRRYAKYINEKAMSYRTVAYDFCRVKRGKDDGFLRTMNTEKLMKALPVLQRQLTDLLDFDCKGNELSNGVINAAFMLLFKDCIRLFACYNEGIINLLEKFFDMNKKMCKDALDTYKSFLKLMDRVADFLKVAEEVGIDKGEIPDLTSAPSSLLDALEQHYIAIDNKKTTKPSSSTTTTTTTSTSSLPAPCLSPGSEPIPESDRDRVEYLEEEKLRLVQLKEQRLQEAQSSGAPSTNPFAPGGYTGGGGYNVAPDSPTNVPDLFSTNDPPQSSSTGLKPSDDLMQLLGSTFGSNVQSAVQSMQYQPAYPATMLGVGIGVNQPAMLGQQSTIVSEHGTGVVLSANNPWANGPLPPTAGPVTMNSVPNTTVPTNSNAPDITVDFERAFGKPASVGSVEDNIDILRPNPINSTSSASNVNGNQTDGGIIGTDLDSALNKLTANLEISIKGASKSSQAWNKSSSAGMKTGGVNWAPRISQSTTGWSPSHQTQQQWGPTPSATQPMMGPPMMVGGIQNTAQPGVGGVMYQPSPIHNPYTVQQQQQQPTQQQQQQQQSNPQDPFGF